MRKVRQIIYILMMCFLYIRNGYSFIIFDYTPLAPMAPQICAQCTPAAINSLMATIETVSAIKEDLESGKLLSQVRQMAKSYAMQLGSSAFNHLKKNALKRNKVVSYSRTIEECNIGGDMTDEAQVKDAFIELFLQYPSDKGPWKKAYENKVNQMKMDTSVEMYVTAVEMSKELDGMLAELDNIEKCIVAGDDCSSVGMEAYNCQSGGSEDNACLWRNALMAVRIYDKIMQYNEFLLAMKTQLEAVKTIGGNVKIREYKKEEKTSLLNNISDTQTAGIAHKYSSGYASASDNKFGFAIIKSAGIKGHMDGKEDDFTSLPIIKEAQDKINEAISSHNLKKMLPNYRKMFEEYHLFNKYYQTVLDNVYTSDKCSINYLGKYYKDGLKAWIGRRCKQDGNSFECEYREQDNSRLGEYNVACSNSSNEKCFVMKQEDFDERSGISAWLMELYQEANIEENNSSEDVYMTVSSSGSGKSLSLSEAKNSANSRYNSDKRGNGEANLKKPSMEDDLYAEMKKNSLLTWTLGAKVSQEVAADMVGSAPKFGITKSLPLWNDQKAFYDLYIEGKYGNIKDYLERQSFFEEMASAALIISEEVNFEDIKNENGEVVSSGENERTKSKQNIQKLQNILSEGGGTNDTSELDKILAEEREALREIHTEYVKNVKIEEKKKTEIYEKLDELSEELSNIRDELKQATDDSSSSESMIAASEEGLFLGQQYKRGNLTSPQDKMFSQQKNEGEELNIQSRSKKDKGVIREKTLTRDIEHLRKQLDSLSDGLRSIDATYVKSYSDKETEYKQKILDTIDSAKEIEKLSEIEDLVLTTLPLQLSKIISEALRQYALDVVDDTVKEIEGLKLDNRLYYAANSSEIHAIHNNMIEKLKNVTLNNLISKSLLSEEVQGMKITETIFEPFKSSFAKILEGKDVPDTEYFVGLVAKDRDFMSPKAPVNFQSASLRDVFHLDQDDFFSIKQFYKGNKDEIPENNKEITTTKKAVLDSGLELPEIWKYILQNRAFVEKDIDMERLLNYGTPGLALVNRGIYPCKDSKTNKYIAMKGINQFVVTTNGGNQYCTNVKLDNKKVYDIEGNAYYHYNNEDIEIDGNTSELGQIFDFVKVIKQVCTESLLGGLPLCRNVIIEEKLTFRQELQDVMRILVNLPDRNIPEDEKDAAKVLYGSILFDRNQYGDFLDMIEHAKAAKESRENMALSINDVRNKLRSVFETMGLTFGDDFDLSLGADYKEAQEVLDEQKNGYINAAKRIIASIKGKSGKITTDRANLLHQLKLLEKDNNEMVTIKGDEDIDDLEEALRTEIANQGVLNEYNKEGNNQMSENTKRLRPPYCSVY